MKKILKIVLIILIIMISNLAILANTVKAVEGEEIRIYTTGNFNRMLKYDGMLIKTARAVYEKDGKEYPAYCLNKDLQGVGDNVSEYEITNLGNITDVGLWRVITNGYPYKSLEQLGVVNEDEAYTATKQSIYCYLYNRGTEKYEGVGETGERTLNAMNIILKNARESNENIKELDIQLLKDQEWKLESEKNYISKEYEIRSNINISKYTIQLENELEGTKITNLENQEKREFNSKEKFKILIPIKNLRQSGNFKINIQTKIESKPVFYGKSPSSELQDYALTAYSFEDATKEFCDEYEKNNTEIVIHKKDAETKELLKEAKFEILNKNQKIIRVVETDLNGEIILKELNPGTYYIRESKAPEGYEINSETTQVDINLNERKIVEIENKKIKIIQEEPTMIEPPKEELEVPKLPVTGM